MKNRIFVKRVFSLLLALCILLPLAAVNTQAAGSTILSTTNLGALSASQDGAIWDGKLFAPNSDNTCKVFTLATRALLGSFSLDSSSAIVPNGNTACFGNTYYAEGDKYPLLYVSVWNKYSSAADKKAGTCCVYRITESGSNFTSELVQVIQLGFASDGDTWAPSTEKRPYGTFVVDTDNSKLYAAVMRDGDNKTRYFKFNVPALTAGTYSDTYGCNVVTLNTTDILSQFDTDYQNFQQGACYYGGKIYATASFISSGVSPVLHVVDLAAGTSATYDLVAGAQSNVITADPADGTLYYVGGSTLYKLTFSEEPDCEHSYTSQVVAPTCSQQGYTLHTCSKCSDSYKDTYTAATDHAYTAGVCAGCSTSILDDDWLAPDFAEGDYTMVVVPDPQRLVELWPDTYYDLTQWIADHKTDLNIQAVMYMGDMVQNKNTDLDDMYAISKKATKTIDDTSIPWMPMMGNHDVSSYFNSYYDYATFGSGKSWFGGSYEANKLDHTYWYVTVGDREYMILSLGWAPSWDVLDWAQDVVEANTDKNVIINCHGYMNKDGSLLAAGDTACVTYYKSGYPEGEDVWAAFKDYENVVLAMGGHIHNPDIATWTDKNGAGKDVTSLLLDRQNDDATDKYAMLAVFTFHEDSDTVDVNWYSTYYDALYKSKNQFQITVPHIENCDHSYTSTETEATCTEAGGTKYTCSLCGDTYTEGGEPALGHDHQPQTTAASCTAPQSVTYTCSRCSDSYTETEAMSYTELSNISVGQDGAIWDGKLFVATSNNSCNVYDLTDLSNLGSFSLDDSSAIVPHCNAVCFGSTYYAEGDKYPLLYATVWNQYDESADRKEGTCCVYRIVEAADGTFSSDLVQVIQVGFTDDASLWAGSEDVRPYGAFMVDTDNDKLYVYVMRDTASKTSYFQFNIPALTDGTYSDAYGCNVVTLESDDILNQFNTNYLNYQQGASYHNGTIYVLEGFVSNDVPPALQQVDPLFGSVIYTYDLNGEGLTAEPTLLSVDPDTGTVYYGTDTGKLYKLTLNVKGHSYTQQTVAPTCTGQGWLLHKCANCSVSVKTDFVDSTGHTEVTDQAVPATCTSTGLTEGKHCSVCDATIVAQQVSPKADHAHGTDWKNDQQNHWNECACGDKANLDTHKDENADEQCDVCAYDMSVPTTTPSTEPTTEPSTEPTTPDSDPTEPGKPAPGGSPDTGDNAMPIVWLVLLGVSGLACTVLLLKKRVF